MVPSSRWTRTRARAWIAAAALLVPACSGDQTPTGFTEEPAFSGGHHDYDYPARLEVKVVAPNGNTPVRGATVRAYVWDGRKGGVVASKVTGSDGIATLKLAPGNYCLSARTAPADWQDLVIVAPGEPRTSFLPPPVTWGPVVSGSYGYVPLTPKTFRDCWKKLPVKVKRSGGSEKIVMAPGTTVTPEILGLDGQPLTGIEVYAVIPVEAPWVKNLPEGVRPAFLTTYDRTASPADLVVSAGAPFALEFQQPLGRFNVTGTVKGTGGSSTVATIEAAPLMCTQTTEDFPSDGHDRSRKYDKHDRYGKHDRDGVDFLRVNYGYHADAAANPMGGDALRPDRTTVSLQLVHRGDGPVTITLRTDTKKGRWTTTIQYDCAKGRCGKPKISDSGNSRQEALVFHMPKPDGSVKTTVVLTRIPADHRQVLFSAKSKHDAIPLTPRRDATSAFFAVPRPKACVIEQSNDDKWLVGDL